MSDQKTEQKPDHEKRIREAICPGDFTMVEVPDLRAILADLDAARAALSEAKAGGWQPIETAPKDGTRFIAWRKHSTRPLIAQYWKDFGWFEDEDGLHLYNLTHWQPLPAPPAQKEPT